MAKKDIAQKALASYNDVFADIINGLLFHGTQRVQEDSLDDASIFSNYKAEGRLHQQERDVSKYWKNGRIRIAFFGLENQMSIDPDMPLRMFGYEGADYRAQMLADNINNKKNEETAEDDTEVHHKGQVSRKRKIHRYPVVSLVLYFGYTQRWNTCHTLLERVKTPECLLPYVNDYRINLFEIAWLSDEQIQYFQSDFRIVADYFIQMRKHRDYTPPETVIQHVHEFLQLMAVLTGDSRYKEIYYSKMEREDTTMCEVLDRVEKRGEMKKAKETALTLHEMDMPVDQIAKAVKVSIAQVNEWLNLSLT